MSLTPFIVLRYGLSKKDLALSTVHQTQIREFLTQCAIERFEVAMLSRAARFGVQQSGRDLVNLPPTRLAVLGSTPVIGTVMREPVLSIGIRRFEPAPQPIRVHNRRFTHVANLCFDDVKLNVIEVGFLRKRPINR